MPKPRVVVHTSAASEIMSSAAVGADLLRRVTAIRSAANQGRTPREGGFTGGVEQQGDRLVGYVVTLNQHGMHAEAKDRRLTKALDAGRG